MIERKELESRIKHQKGAIFNKMKATASNRSILIENNRELKQRHSVSMTKIAIAIRKKMNEWSAEHPNRLGI